MDTLSTILDRTQTWLRDFVVGLNLCPFAGLPFKENRIRYRVYDGQNTEELLSFIYAEIEFLDAIDPDQIETTLIIIPAMLQTFKAYLDIVDMSESILIDLKLEGIIQIASFHPLYQFADTTPDDITNYTNRAPYALIHLLREDRVTAAINSYGDTSKIPERNKNLLRSMKESEVKNLSSGQSKTDR